MKKILVAAVIGLVCVTASAQKFAHVNFQETWMLCPEADQARATMTVSSKEAQETYQSMVDEFQGKYQAYQQKASTWTQAIRESKEKELTEIQQRIQEFEQTVQQELQQQEQQLYAPIMQKAQDAVNKIAKEKGFIYVFLENTILYIDKTQSVDITMDVRKAMGVPEDRTMESLQKELEAQAQQAQ